MKYSFKDIENQAMYDTAQVLFITGPYNIFNNIVSDKLRFMCKGSLELGEEDNEVLREFNMSAFDDGVLSNTIDFQTFIDVVKMPAVTGKWFCSVDYKMLTKKQRDMLDKFYKRPSENGVLVVSLSEFNDYKYFLKNRIIASSVHSHLIQLSFPNRRGLVDIVTNMLNERDVKVVQKAAELFVLRMSSSYDDYEEVIDRISLDNKGNTLTYEDMVNQLKGIENYVLDDFLFQLTAPIRSKKIVATRKIYRMEAAMLQEFGARKLVTKLKYKVEDLIEMRMLINKGIIPIRVKYSVEEAKKRMGENNRLNKLSEFSFRKTATLASKTSLKDWILIKMILNSVDSNKSPDSEFERVLHIIINRSVLPEIRIKNDIGVANIINEGLFDINSRQYVDKARAGDTSEQV